MNQGCLPAIQVIFSHIHYMRGQCWTCTLIRPCSFSADTNPHISVIDTPITSHHLPAIRQQIF